MSATYIRLITAVALILSLLFTLLYLPDYLFLYFSVFALIAVWEWGMLCLSGMRNHAIWLVFFILLQGMLLHFFTVNLWFGSMLFGIVWWLCSLALLIYCERRKRILLLPRHLWLGLGICFILPPWLAFYHLSIQREIVLLLFLIGLICLVDSTAYGIGRYAGRRRLAPTISPGKTWEGTVAGVVCGLLFSVLYACFQLDSYHDRIVFSLIGLLSAIMSVVGDLMASLLKRTVGIKHSSFLLPGHGGFLDRIDGMCAAAPFFVVGLLFAGMLQ